MEGSLQFNQEPTKVTNALDPKQELPTFDIVAVNKMIQPSIDNSVATKQVAPEAIHHVLHPEQEEFSTRPDAEPALGKLEVAPGVDGPRKVMRPGDRKEKNILAKLGKPLAASLAVVAGLGGALGSTEAKAEGIPGLEQAGKVIGVQVLTNILAQTPLAVGIDNQGNPMVVAKTPAQMAITRPAVREPGVEQVAASMGLSIIEQGIIFSISRYNNPADNVNIKKYYDSNHYTTGINLRRAPNGGLLLSTSYIDNGQLHSQMSIINIDTTGKIVTTIMGN